MNTATCNGAAPCAVPENARRSRQCCIDLLATVLEHAPGGVRGTAVFLLDCSRAGRADERDADRCLDDAVVAEAARRVRAAAPGWHRLLRGERGEFIVIAQGLVDGGAVLGAAARLVHAFDDALQSSDMAICPEVAIGISFAPQHGARAEAMLAAAESGLRESIATARLGQRTTLQSIPPLGSFN